MFRTAAPADLALDPDFLTALDGFLKTHVAEGRVYGCQVAIARRETLVYSATYGSLQPDDEAPGASETTLWPFYSITKILTACAVWLLAGRGLLDHRSKVCDFLPGFSRGGKDTISVGDLLTHQAGFPHAAVSPIAWTDHQRLRDEVEHFSLEWQPGSKVYYHPESGYWVLAAIIEEITGQDYRDFISQEILRPLGLSDELYLGLPPELGCRVAQMHWHTKGGEAVKEFRRQQSTPGWQQSGAPASGAIGTARALACFMQMLAQKGRFGGRYVLPPQQVALATQDHTGPRLDEANGVARHYGLGPWCNGPSSVRQCLGTAASEETFGHTGGRNALAWADPVSGVSFAYLSNCFSDSRWSEARFDELSNFVHRSIR